MAETKTAAAAKAATTTVAEAGLLDSIVEQGRFGKDAPAKERGKDMIKRFVSEVLEGSITMDTEARRPR